MNRIAEVLSKVFKVSAEKVEIVMKVTGQGSASLMKQIRGNRLYVKFQGKSVTVKSCAVYLGVVCAANGSHGPDIKANEAAEVGVIFS